MLLSAAKLVLVSCLSLVLTACLITVDSDERSRSSQWVRHDADRMVIGETSEAWVRETFGTPERQSSYADGTKVWRYENSRNRETEVGIFLLFHFDVEREEADVLAIEMTNGTVTDYWTESR